MPTSLSMLGVVCLACAGPGEHLSPACLHDQGGVAAHTSISAFSVGAGGPISGAHAHTANSVLRVISPAPGSVLTH